MDIKRFFLAAALAAVVAGAAAPQARHKVDVDLTRMSSTLIFGEVFNMMIAPRRYEGKIVRIKGLAYISEFNGRTMYACIVQDATACCAQGLEFRLDGTYTAADYPAEYDEITVTGRYHQYEEDGVTFIALVDCTLG